MSNKLNIPQCLPSPSFGGVWGGSRLCLLLYDNYDSFSYLLVDYLRQAEAEVLVLRNDEPYEEFMLLHKFDGVVLSPGPERPENAGFLMEFVKKYHKELPMLGVCLGHQALGLLLGLSLEKAVLPMHGKKSLIENNGKGIFEGLPSAFEVCRYHSLVLEGESTEIEISATSPTGEIMAFTHKSLPLSGVQFHPEAILTKFGMEMIRNWVG